MRTPNKAESKEKHPSKLSLWLVDVQSIPFAFFPSLSTAFLNFLRRKYRWDDEALDEIDKHASFDSEQNQPKITEE